MTIPQTFKKRGYTYGLATHIGSVAVYEQKHNETGRIMAHEVHVVRFTTKDSALPGGLVIPKGSPVLPSSEDWGTYGWTVRTLHDAMDLIRRKGLATPRADAVHTDVAMGGVEPMAEAA